MKQFLLLPFTVLIALTATSCDQSEDEAAILEDRVEELEKKNSQALEKQRLLEDELEGQRLTTERDSLERARALADEVRYTLEQDGEATPEQVEGLLKQENEIAERELILEGRQNDHFERQYAYRANPLRVSDEDLALAGQAIGGFSTTVEEDETIDERDFYQELSPYGAWFESADYGYVWQPAVHRDSSWSPYLRGRWACSDRGWAWISNEPFGWATYHYGRWAHLADGRGWIWVPGTEWAPSWCTWRQSGSSIGWAPLPPATLRKRGGTVDPCADDLPGVNDACYTFVETEHFDQPISRVCVPKAENSGRLKHAKNVTRLQRTNGRVFSGGPGYLDLSERIGRRMAYLQIERRQGDLGRAKAVRPGVKARGERLIVTAPTVIPKARELARPPRVRGQIENSQAPSRARFQPRVEIVQGPSRADYDDDLGARVMETLGPDLTLEAWEAGFPTDEMEPKKIMMPELMEAALKPVEVAVEEAAATEEGEERVARNGEEKGKESRESVNESGRENRSEVAEKSARSRPREEVSAPAREASRPQPSRGDNREKEEAEEGKGSPRGR
ncbi:DUF6600 domain-containing protein [Verrucomicrobiaceae bacterium 227]